jgi:hypothetical protein
VACRVLDRFVCFGLRVYQFGVGVELAESGLFLLHELCTRECSVG